MMLNCIVIDDDEISRLVINRFIEKSDFLTLTCDINNREEAWDILFDENPRNVDVFFLDIEMPRMTRSKLMKLLQNNYHVIFITSKEDHIANEFEDSVVDYLVKPVEYEQFVQVTSRVKDIFENNGVLAKNEGHIYVKCDGKIYRLSYDDILFVEALADYIIFNTESGHKHIVHYTMKGIEKRLPGSIFSRVHRSHIINRNKILRIENLRIFIESGRIFSIGPSYKKSLLNKINFL